MNRKLLQFCDYATCQSVKKKGRGDFFVGGADFPYNKKIYYNIFFYYKRFLREDIPLLTFDRMTDWCYCYFEYKFSRNFHLNVLCINTLEVCKNYKKSLFFIFACRIGNIFVTLHSSSQRTWATLWDDTHFWLRARCNARGHSSNQRTCATLLGWHALLTLCEVQRTWSLGNRRYLYRRTRWGCWRFPIG